MSMMEEYKTPASWKNQPLEVSSDREEEEEEEDDDDMPIQEGTGSQGQRTMEMGGSGKLAVKKGPKSPMARLPNVLIEGPEPSQDLSFKWVQRNPKVQLIEQGVAISDFDLQCKIRDLASEYKLVKVLTETREHKENRERFINAPPAATKLNRYKELEPFKHTRVRLAQRNADVYDSFINANYINSSTSQNDQLFIATQGTLAETTENFWRMIWQENVQLCLMLTCVYEGTIHKCHQYFPAQIEEFLEFKDLRVTLISVESVMPSLIKRKIRIHND